MHSVCHWNSAAEIQVYLNARQTLPFNNCFMSLSRHFILMISDDLFVQRNIKSWIWRRAHNLVLIGVVLSTRLDLRKLIKGRDLVRVRMLVLFSSVVKTCGFYLHIYTFWIADSRRHVRFQRSWSDVLAGWLIVKSRILTRNQISFLIPPGRYLCFNNVFLTVSILTDAGENEWKLNTWERDFLIL